MNLQIKSRVGFSLFEMAITLTILSILLASVFTLVPVKQEQQNIDEINSKLTRIQQALDSFYNQNGYLPCPARLNANFSDVGSEIGLSQDCSGIVPGGITSILTPGGEAWIGAIPTRTLNLPDDMMFDPWNHRIEYGVVTSLAQNKNNYSSFTTLDSLFVLQDSNLNQINTDSTSNSDPKAVNIVAYVLFSHGKDGNGSTNTSGNTRACAFTALDDENCDNNHIFIDSTYNSSSGASYYDDYIRWKTNQQQARDGTLGGGSGNGVGSTAGNSYSLVGNFVEQYSDGTTDAGTCTASSWNPRNINTTIVNNLANASLSSNQITLAAGNYMIRASGPAFNVGASLIRIYNVTAGSTIAYGDVVYSGGTSQMASVASVAVTFTTSTVIQIDQYCTTTQASSGLGIHGTIPNGVPYNFTQVEIWQKL